MLTALLLVVAQAQYTECVNGKCALVTRKPFTNQYAAWPPAGSIVVLPSKAVTAAPAASKAVVVARTSPVVVRKAYGPIRRVLRRIF